MSMLSGSVDPRRFSGTLTDPRPGNELRETETGEEALQFSAGKVLESLDELSTLLTLFRQRRDMERRQSLSTSASLECVLDSDAEDKFRELVAIARTGGISAAVLLSHARRLFPDDSNLLEVLRQLLRLRDPDKSRRKMTEQALQLAEDEIDSGKARSGINVALKARLFGRKLGLSAAMIRRTYFDFLSSAGCVLTTWGEWISEYGYERRHYLLDFIESAVVADMDSLEPGLSEPEFGSLSVRLGQLKVLRTTDMQFIRSMLACCRNGKIPLNEQDLLFLLMIMLEAPDDLLLAVRQIYGPRRKRLSYRQQSFFIQRLRAAVKAFPDSVFIAQEDKELIDQTLLMAGDEFYWLETE